MAAGAPVTFPPTQGDDKGKVEGLVRYVWRIFPVPLPRVPSFGPGFVIEAPGADDSRSAGKMLDNADRAVGRPWDRKRLSCGRFDGL